MSHLKEIDLLNAYFDKIYLISIERTRIHRSEKLKKNLEGINYCFFEGVDASIFSEEEINKIANLNDSKILLDEYFEKRFNFSANRALRKSEIGCSLSHQKIYKDMIEKGYKRVLIFEDDAKLELQNIKHIPSILNSIPNDCDLLYWGYRWFDSESRLSRFKRKFIITPLNWILFKSKKNQNEFYPKYYNKKIWNAGFHAGTHAYSINLKSAKILLESNTPIKMNADQLISYQLFNDKLRCYVTIPLIFREDQSVPTSLNL
jgi:glycosyl transferase family 25